MIKKEIEIVLDADKATADAKKFSNTLEDVDKEAKKAGKSVDDVAGNGGAIAVLDSLTGGLATRLKDAYEASKLFNFSLKATRGALIATGIGAFVVALGLVVVYWDEIVDFITGSNRELEKQIDLLGDEAELSERKLKILEDSDNILKLQGKSQAEINRLKKIELNDIIEARREQLLAAKERLQEIKDLQKAGGGTLEQFTRFAQESLLLIGTVIDKTFAKFGLTTTFAKTGVEFSESAIESIFGSKEELAEAEKRINDLDDSIRAARNTVAGFALESKAAAEALQKEIDERPQVSTVGGGLTAEGFGGNIAEDPEVIFEEGKAARLKLINDELTQFLMDNANRQLLQQEVISTARIGLEENTLSLLRNIAERGSALSKAVAIADVVREQVRSVSGIISNTGIANAKAVAASPTTLGQPWVTLNTVGAGLGIAASIAGAGRAIKDITSGKSSLSSGGFGGGIGGGGASAPSFNLVQGSGTNQIAEGLQGQEQPIRAYVVSNDVTNAQELDRNIQGDASLG